MGLAAHHLTVASTCKTISSQHLETVKKFFEDAVDNITDTIDENLKGDAPKQTSIEATIAKHNDRVSKPQRAWKARIDNYRPRYLPVDLRTK